MTPIKKKYQRKVTDIATLHYINLDGMKITVFSPYEVMVNELLSIGVNPMGKTIKVHNPEVGSSNLPLATKVTYLI